MSHLEVRRAKACAYLGYATLVSRCAPNEARPLETGTDLLTEITLDTRGHAESDDSSSG